MEKTDTIQPPVEPADTIPGPFFPDRCLLCPALLDDGYGSVKRSKCVDCVSVSVRRTIRRTDSFAHKDIFARAT